MLRAYEQLRGLAALVVIVVLGGLGLLLSGIPLVRKVAFVGVALVGVMAAINEVRR